MKVVQGQRVAIPIGSTGLLVEGAHTLARGEDANVRSWQVTLAPITQNGVGSNDDGMPSHRNPAGATGRLACRLTWGGGGVGYQTRFAYPINGASFSVSGDNVMVEVFPQDFATAFTDATRPAAAAWLKPGAVPQTQDPIVVWGTLAAVATPLSAFQRAIHIAHDTPGATVQVTFATTLGVLAVIQLSATEGVTRIPIPANAETVLAVASAGLVSAGFELAFT